MTNLEDVPEMIELLMDGARNHANRSRINKFSISAECMGFYYQGRLAGMRYAVFYGASEFAPYAREAADAFMAAENELDFLYGRYQEQQQ